MQDYDPTAQALKRWDCLFAARDRALASVQRAEEVRRIAAKLLDEAHRILKETRWTGARRGP